MSSTFFSPGGRTGGVADDVLGRWSRWIPLVLFVAALAAYAAPALWSGRTASPPTAYFDRLAGAFLSGRLDLEAPPSTEDLTFDHDRWYVAFPPVPALLLLPWVAWKGVAGTSTVWFSVLLGATNVVLIHGLLRDLARRGWTPLGESDRLWLTLLFGLGSVHWYMAADGDVWFVGQVCAVTFTALAARAAVSRRPAWSSGLALAAAMGARLHVVLAWPLLAGIAAEDRRDSAGRLDRRRWVAWGVRSALPVLLGVALLGLYNQARFGNPFDLGYGSMNVDESFAREIHGHGAFSLAYVPRNLRTMVLGLPRIPEGGGLEPDPNGMSLFLITPALVYIFRAGFRSPRIRGAWIALGSLLVPILTYNSTGYWQFGYRFGLDLIVPLMILVAAGAGRRVSWTMRGLILAGVVVNLWGVRWWY